MINSNESTKIALDQLYKEYLNPAQSVYISAKNKLTIGDYDTIYARSTNATSMKLLITGPEYYRSITSEGSTISYKFEPAQSGTYYITVTANEGGALPQTEKVCVEVGKKETGNSGSKFTIKFGNEIYHYSADTKLDKFILNTLLLDDPVYLEQRKSVTDEPMYVLENYYAHNGPVWEYILACWLKDVRLKYENNGYTFEEYISISNVIRDMLKCTTNGRGALLSDYYDPNSNSALQVIYMRLNLSDEAYANGLSFYQTSLLAAAIDGRTYGYIERVTGNINTLSIFATMFLGEIASVVTTITGASAKATSREILLKQMERYNNAILETDKRLILSETSSLIKTVAEAEELFAQLEVNGIKFTREATQWICKTPSGNIIWLEIGNDSAGLQHIMLRHSTEFSSWGLNSQEAVSTFIENAVKNGTPNVIGTGDSIYNVTVNGVTKQMEVITGSNGFIVTAHPYTP